ncbi:MAG: Gfo/Idh/MocA family oxidoreductase [Victivallaceae bacterium]|nr:Gfo/Idh/MocA family oxidoreductase [Victivallaceae bacterium]NLK82835.1 Gfo/Idh/MocA family oxidoreductase [Lentisphaerota bacterium]MDD3115760.1 Gfo/Idh/MocA family oxidoreductase [Victivallaceae bacterium]MDD3703715.1 Gfo/Idh/MocA family oxidoreductase [Victivallaceae bacterium]MDD4317177.1 Gfo/Idh/MocA family oxidoreductase [Victivallaceae bacterium]
MEKVRIGIIGLGFMGTTHFRIYRGLPNAEIIAIADVDADKRRGDITKVSGNIGNEDNTIPLDLNGVKAYDSGLALIEDPNVDVVDICVPTPDHKDLIIAALGKGKHVFSEKPLCRNLAEMAEIEQAVKSANTFFNVGMCIRAWPEYFHAQKLYKSGVLGKVRSAMFRRLSPSIDGNSWKNWFMDNSRSGGALLDLHLHDTDLVCYFFGSPRAVNTFGVRGVCSDNGFDHVITNYDFGDNSLIMAEGGWTAPRTIPFEMSFQIICEKGTLRFNHEGYKIHWNDGKIETPEINIGELPTGWHQELNYFVDCVKNNVTPNRYQTPQQIFESFKVIMAEMQSAETQGKTVEVK